MSKLLIANIAERYVYLTATEQCSSLNAVCQRENFLMRFSSDANAWAAIPSRSSEYHYVATDAEHDTNTNHRANGMPHVFLFNRKFICIECVEYIIPLNSLPLSKKFATLSTRVGDQYLGLGYGNEH